jgi:hypothetical protein
MKVTMEYVVGKRGNGCQLCGMAGCLKEKYIVTDEVVRNPDAAPPRALLCITCFDTGAGLESDNQVHKRLPSAEYAKDRATKT